MVRRTISFLVALFALCSLLGMSGCQKKETAYELIQKATDKTEALGSVSCEMDATLAMGMKGVTMKIPFSAAVKVADLQKESPRARGTVNMEIPVIDMAMELEVYYEGDYLYLSVLGEGVKFNIPLYREWMEAKNPADPEGEKADEESDALEKIWEGVPVETNEDGTRTVRLVMTQEFIAQIMAEAMKDLSEEDREDFSQIKIGEIECVYTVSEEDYFEEIYISYDMTIEEDAASDEEEAESTAMDLKLEMTVSLLEPGKAVEVIPIQGCEDFEEAMPPEFEEDSFLGDGIFT